MLRNYLTIACRNLWRNKLYTVLNISGLAIGISACLVIYLIVSFELSFDTFHPDRDRIYRVYSQFSGTFDGTNPGVVAAVPALVRDKFTGIETSVSFHTYVAKVNLPSHTKTFERQKVIITEPEYFDVFGSYQWLAGSPEVSLTAPFQVVLTESKAKVYFGNAELEKMLGRQIHYDDSLIVTVSGIVKDLPRPTDFIFDDFISFSTISHSWLKDKIDLADWNSTNSSSQLFIKLSEGTSPSKITAQLLSASKIYHEQNKDGSWKVDFHLQALSDFHFNTSLGIFDNTRTAAHLPTLRTLAIISLLLLLIAAINFVNLVTAQSVRRAKEVGVRKVLGSTRKELISQFLSETLLITTIAVLFSLLLTDLSLTYFQEFIPLGVALHLSDYDTLLFLLSTVLVVSILSGLYPAFILSSFTPVFALKSQIHTFSGRIHTAFLRKGLIVFQFSFAQVLIVGTVIMGSQIDFMLSKDLGFNKDAILTIHTPWNNAQQRFILKQELSKLPEVTDLSMHDQPPAGSGYSSSVIEYDNGKEILKQNVYRKFGDSKFIYLYDIPLLAGSNLQTSDTVREFLINETYARQLGFTQPAQALGKILRYSDKDYPIVGVVKDFHIQSLHNPIQPVIIASEVQNFYSFSLKLSTNGKRVNDFNVTIDKINRIWKELYPDDKFTYTFIDDAISKFYEAEQRASKLVRTATSIAVFISCLGLFGLATYTAQTRTKEIGVRKVLGASVANIVTLLSRDFIRLVLSANLIAWPLAWWVTNKWLEDFAYQIDINPGIFMTSGILAMLIALLTVSYQSIRAALANPVKSLRNE